LYHLYLTTLASVTVLGSIFGLGLALAAKKLKVEGNSQAKKINSILPGTNCGACGYAGCQSFAEAVASKEAPPYGCLAGGNAVTKAIAKIMGVATSSFHHNKKTQIARVHCQGGTKTSLHRSIYQGIPSCEAAELVEGGFKACIYGCLGLGDCARACPFEAILIGQEEIPVVDNRLCTGCGHCVKACPRNLISLANHVGEKQVLCNSADKGKRVTEVCRVGCTGCRRCIKACSQGAISIKNQLAVVDQSLCRRCMACLEVCPTGAIKESPPLVGLR